MKRLFVVAMAAASASCSGAPRRSALATPAEEPLSRAPVAAVDTTTASARLERGRQTVQTVCSACHTLAPPPTKAPPFPMVAMVYHRGRSDSAAAAAIVAWVRKPAADRSLLPPMMVQRFGLMPALPLDERTLGDAALYILSLDRMGGMNGMGGMMHGRGMPPAGGP
jgi:mono/diheme cytochrome c family protein